MAKVKLACTAICKSNGIRTYTNNHMRFHLRHGHILITPSNIDVSTSWSASCNFTPTYTHVTDSIFAMQSIMGVSR